MREVIKTIRGRQYRYRVDRVRDEKTGKMRSAWTYLGPSDGTDVQQPVRPREPAVKPRLLDALTRLLESSEGGILPTAGAIAKEAGLGHGTFYRHFKNKEAALDELIVRLRGEFDESFPVIVGTERPALASVRRNLAAWVRASIQHTKQNPGMVRAFLNRALSEPERRAAREIRRRTTLGRIEKYLVVLHGHRLASIDDPPASAAAIMMLIESGYWSAQRRLLIDDVLERGIIAAIDRAVFGEPPPQLDLNAEAEAERSGESERIAVPEQAAVA